jgi:NADH-quinone oxidoreductase subunit G
VNEIWICDKGRFVHHFADSPQRLTTPLVREDGQLVETTWEDALDLVAGRLQMNKLIAAGLAGDRLSNEDFYMFQKLFRQGLDSNNVDLLPKQLAGGDVVAKVGFTSGSNLRELGKGDAILVVASDLHEEAPVWWLRVKQAAERGAKLVVFNLRQTRLDRYADHAVRYEPGQALFTIYRLLNSAKVDADDSSGDPLQAVADALVEADNLVVFYGCEGLSYEETNILARLLGNLLLVRQLDEDDGLRHAGRVNNGLIPVWPGGNTQGAWDMGLRPDAGPGYQPLEEAGLDASGILEGVKSGDVKALYLVGADPVGDGLLESRDQLEFLVVQDLFLTESAALADVVLPAQSWAEREGTFTNGERRIQRFYPAIQPVGQCRPDWQILAQIGERVGLGKPPFAASLLFKEIASNIPQFDGLDYRSLAWTELEWPMVGGEDLYYGGTSYKNKSGLGLQWPVAAENESVDSFDVPDIVDSTAEGLVAVGIAALYTRGSLINKSEVLDSRIANRDVYLNSEDAQALGITNGDSVSLSVNGHSIEGRVSVNGLAPEGVALIRGFGHLGKPALVEIE